MGFFDDFHKVVEINKDRAKRLDRVHQKYILIIY